MPRPPFESGIRGTGRSVTLGCMRPLRFLLDAVGEVPSVVAYRIAGKGNALPNYSGVWPDLLPFVVDRDPAKQSRYLADSRIRFVGEAETGVCQTRPPVDPAGEHQRRVDGKVGLCRGLGWNVRDGGSETRGGLTGRAPRAAGTLPVR